MDLENNTINNFTRKNYRIIVFIFAFTFLTYFFRIISNGYSIDTELFIKDRIWTLNWWLQIDRYGLVFLKKIFLGNNILLANILTYTLLACNITFLCYLFWRLTKANGTYLIFASMVFLTSPIIFEQTNFVLQSAEIMIGFFSLLLSFYLVILFLETSKKKYVFLAIPFCVVALSIYPPFQTSFVLLAVAFSNLLAKDLIDFIVRKGGVFIGILVFTVAINKLLSNTILKVKHLPHSDYLTNYSVLKSEGMSAYLSSLKSAILNNFFSYTSFCFFVLTILLFVYLAIICIKFKEVPFLIELLTIAICCLAVIFPAVFVGKLGPIRSYFPTFQIALFFFSFKIFTKLSANKTKLLLACILLLGCSIQFFNITKFQRSESRLFSAQVNLADEIKKKLTPLKINTEDYYLAVVGNKTFVDNKTIVRGDILGKSFWEGAGETGASKRVTDFLYTRGIKFKNINADQYKLAVTFLDDAPAFPINGSVVIKDDIVIIKFE